MTKSIPPRIEPVVGALRVVGGARQKAGTCATTSTPPPRAARGKEKEYLFILLNLEEAASPHLYRELREVISQTYWAAAGSVTSALRRTALAASRHLFQANLYSIPSDRCYGSLVCAVLHGEDLFILQSGPARPCILHDGYLKHFCYEELPRLGMKSLTETRLYHTLVADGDTLLLVSPSLSQESSGEALARILARDEVPEVLAGVEQIGTRPDFVALIARWRSSEKAEEVKERPVPQPSPQVEPGHGIWPILRRWMEEKAHHVGRGIGRGVVGAGAWLTSGAVALGARLVSGAGTLFRRMLPGSEQKTRRRARKPRPTPKENRAVMMTLAIGIPLFVAIVVGLTYRSFGREEHYKQLIDQATQEITLAQGAAASEEARPHWEAALEYANAAVAQQPDNLETLKLQEEAQTALDVLDDVVRLTSVHLWDFGESTALRQLVVHGQMIFVLDPVGGWVAQLTLNPAGDSVIEQDVATILAHTGQRIDGKEMGNLVDLAWMPSGGARQASGLVILEKEGAMVNYDPAWADEEGRSSLERSLLGAPPSEPEPPRSIDSFEGNLYVLKASQIWRYNPQGNTYPDQPAPYFVTSPPQSLENALDMAIDGNIYLLYADGAIFKFRQGESQSFEMQRIPGDIDQAIAFTVDQNSRSGLVYVADRGNKRVLELDSDGLFRAQFRTTEAFDKLEALAVDEIAGQLYVISDGQLYTASLPQLP